MSLEASTSAPTRRVVLYRVGVVVLFALITVAIVRGLRTDGPAALAAWQATHVRWGWVAVAMALVLSAHLIWVMGWRRLLSDLAVRAELIDLLRIFVISNLGRYLPGGKAWQLGLVGVMATERGLPAAVLAGTSLVHGVIGLIVGAVMLAATGGASLGLSPSWMALPILGVAGLLATPIALRSSPALRSFVTRYLPSIDMVTVSTMIVLILTAVASWLGWGAALYALACALLPDPVASPTTYLSAWIGPGLAGLVAVMAPAGLGVRDTLMQTTLTAAGVGAGQAIVIAVVSRVWTTIVEVLPALVLLAFRRGAVTTPMSLEKCT